LAAVEQRIGNRPVEIQLPDDLPVVAMDLVLMTQVVMNLLDNAHKYAPAESTIEVSATTDNDWLSLEVADRGPGVPEHDLKRVFDKFYRIPIPEGAGGTGLGLSICKGIVEAHGGRIRAENRTGGGLRIVIVLPIAKTGVLSHDS
jgi:two-component system sensor histidine kinase KdpD